MVDRCKIMDERFHGIHRDKVPLDSKHETKIVYRDSKHGTEIIHRDSEHEKK